MNWINEAVADSGPKTPVRDALREVLGEVARMHVAGASWAAIFRTLKKEGKDVGAGVSSFNNARRLLQDELDVLIEEARVGEGGDAAAIANQATSSAEQSTGLALNRDRFADDRKPLTFGAH
ncbi:hypothetical protein [Aurantiacibacter suaedae]|uniref:hypothetical protein n=1 Tax=Aurantiacibacter suaedae TaxID=2545755 RepID=UPI0010F9B2F7|nr:hypothetical protein [Aurantiacibacter suaedae]